LDFLRETFMSLGQSLNTEPELFRRLPMYGITPDNLWEHYPRDRLWGYAIMF
jgi:hypothetical protein